MLGIIKSHNRTPQSTLPVCSAHYVSVLLVSYSFFFPSLPSSTWVSILCASQFCNRPSYKCYYYRLRLLCFVYILEMKRRNGHFKIGREYSKVAFDDTRGYFLWHAVVLLLCYPYSYMYTVLVLVMLRNSTYLCLCLNFVAPTIITIICTRI